MNLPSIDELLVAARRHHEAGQLQLAEPMYRQVLSSDANRPDAWHGLGLIAYQTGRPADAATCIARAIALESRMPAFHCNLGLALRALGKRDDALAAYRKALELDPNFPEALTNLGTLLKDLGRPREALDLMRRAAHLRPGDAWMHHNLGNTQLALADAPGALESFNRALATRPAFPEAANNRGLTFEQLGDVEAAKASYRTALAARPGFADATNNLARLLRHAGQFEEAIAILRTSLQIKEQPSLVEALATAFQEIGKWNEAVACWRRLIDLEKASPTVGGPLGSNAPATLVAFANSLIKLGKLDESIEASRSALALAPDLTAAHNNLGAALVERGDVADSIRAYAAALVRSPNWLPAHSNVLLNLNYLDDASPQWLAWQHRRWAAQLEGVDSPVEPTIAGPIDLSAIFLTSFAAPALAPVGVARGERPLRLGYVSADFRLHPVAHFFDPVLRHHDRSRFEIHCYSQQMTFDRITRQMQGYGDCWRRIDRLDDAAAAELIRRDAIDVLVDLSGHTGNNRLGVFARKPAPLQMSWIGYPNTTGLKAMDYRVTDAIADPPDEPNVHVERLLRLPRGFCCYAPLDEIPASGPLPALTSGRFTFGSMHNLAKLNPATLDLWAAALTNVPNARLLYFRNTLHGVADKRLRAAFAERGVREGQLDFRSLARGEIEYLRIFDEIDVCLDALPWSGHTTTCEALWQGVPTLTLLGDRHAGRMAASIMTHAGLPDFVARSPAEYVAKASALAADLQSLARLRGGMREQMLLSPLGDAAAFTRAWEDALTKLLQGDLRR